MFPALRDFHDDAFFSGPMENVRRMETMIDSMMSPFGGMFGSMGIPRQPQGGLQHSRSTHNHNSLMPYGFGHSLFPNMDDMFNNFGQMTQAPNCHSFSSSSVMTYSTDETGQPQVYQATSSTRTAPGGVKETRETLQDSRSGLQKMAIGHHLNERAHVVEKKKYRYTGDEEENHEYVNLEDDEADTFDNEWQQRAGGFRGGHGVPAVEYESRSYRDREPNTDILAITDGSQHGSRQYAEASHGAATAGRRRPAHGKKKGSKHGANHKSNRTQSRPQE